MRHSQNWTDNIHKHAHKHVPHPIKIFPLHCTIFFSAHGFSPPLSFPFIFLTTSIILCHIFLLQMVHRIDCNLLSLASVYSWIWRVICGNAINVTATEPFHCVTASFVSEAQVLLRQNLRVA